MIERAMVLTDDSILAPEHFPAELDKKTDPSARTSDILSGYSLKTAQKALEKELITKALIQTKGNRTHAAKLLEISHPSLLSKIKTYNIEE